MSEQRERRWRNWGDHPIVVLIGLIVASITLFGFITGKTRLADYVTIGTVTAAPTLILPASIRTETPPFNSMEPMDTTVSVVATIELPTSSSVEVATQTPIIVSLRRLEVADNYDHFVSVRLQPISTSTEIKRLYTGDIVFCSYEMQGENIKGASTWIYCPDEGGFIFLPLLIPRS